MKQITPFTLPGSEKSIQMDNINDFLFQASGDIAEIKESLNQHAHQFEEHNAQMRELNQELKVEAVARTKADQKNRRFTLLMTLLSFSLGLIVNNLPWIIRKASELIALLTR